MSFLEDALKKNGTFAQVKPTTTLNPDNITGHFTWKEALFLPTWNRLAEASDGLNDEVKANLVKVFTVLESIRAMFGDKPISIHCAYRPSAYNIAIGGASRSAHTEGKAIDFSIAGISCDDVRIKLVSELDKLLIRMEHLDKSTWIHIDTRQSQPRYFIP